MDVKHGISNCCFFSECQNIPFTPWAEQPCKGGPCAYDWEKGYVVDETCKNKLDVVFGVESDNEGCTCKDQDKILAKTKGYKIGDVATLKDCLLFTGDTGGGSISSCQLKLYYYIDENKKGGWYRLKEFESLVFPYLKSLEFIQHGNEYEQVYLNRRLQQSFGVVYDWQANRGISNNWVDIDFSNAIRGKVNEALWAESSSGKIDYPAFDPTDLLVIFGKPLLSVSKYLISTLGGSAYLLATKGTQTAGLYYLLNSSERKLLATVTEKGLLTELNFLSGNIKKYETLVELRNVNYLRNGFEHRGFIQYVKSGDEFGWLVNEAGKVGLLSKISSHTHLSSWVNKLDEVADAAFISKIDNLATTNPNKLLQLDDFYKNMKAPAGKKGMIDFDVQIDGKNLHYDKTGMPDFVPHTPTVNGSKIKYQSQSLNGSSTDMTAANNWALNQYGANNFQKISGSTKCKIKIGDDWIEHTWHHHQDGRTMFPVPSSLHSAAPHSGGASIIEKGLQDFFDSPIL